MPGTMMAAAKAAPGKNSDFQTLWLKTARTFATAAPQGRYIEAPAGHYIHRDRPASVRDEIRRPLIRLP